MRQARLRFAPEAVVGKTLEQLGRQHGGARAPLDPAAHPMRSWRAEGGIEGVRFERHVLEVVAEFGLAQQPV